MSRFSDAIKADVKATALMIRLKGVAEPLVYTASDPNVAVCELNEHLSKRGFAGWRRLESLHLDMAEVQAFWLVELEPAHSQAAAKREAVAA